LNPLIYSTENPDFDRQSMSQARDKRFEQALASQRPITIDGGLATQLEAQGCNIDGSLWSAALLQSDPAAIVAAHRAFLDAGARVIISASYQASAGGFMKHGMSRQDAEELIASSVGLACRARDDFLTANPDCNDTPLVAASIGPWGACQHDGSEYTGQYNIDDAALRLFQQQRLELLDRTNADLLACETIPNLQEARALSELLADTRLPTWVSFCCKDERRLSDGTPLGEACALFRDHPQVLALGVNCTAPQYVTALIGEIRAAAPDKAIVVYPNSGERYHAATNSWSGDASAAGFATYAEDWRNAGARLIGGCCRVGPQQIAAVHACLAT
jgi:homocysteine S-methyltransferase